MPSSARSLEWLLHQTPDSVRSNYILLGIVTGIILIWGGTAFAAKFGMAPLPFILAGSFPLLFPWLCLVYARTYAIRLSRTRRYSRF